MRDVVAFGQFGEFKIRKRDGYLVCEKCGRRLTLSELRKGIVESHTGFLYCSEECAKEDAADFLKKVDSPHTTPELVR